ncbi:MAG: response regulator [Sphingomicrobium sp.]
MLDEPLGGGRGWLVPGLVAAAAGSGAILFWALGAGSFAWLFFAGFVTMLVASFILERRSARAPEPLAVAVPDLALLGTALALSDESAALTDGEGQIIVANPAYRDRFPGAPPPHSLSVGLAEIQASARREGYASGSVAEDAPVHVERAGTRGDLLLWRFPHPPEPDALTIGARQIAGATGERFAAAGVLAALVDERGRVLAANKPFADRAVGVDQSAEAPLFDRLVELSTDGQALLRAEGEQALPLRAVHVPLDAGRDGGPGTWLLFGGHDGQGGSGANIQALLDVLPVGLALVDRDGRFLTANKAFRTAGGVKSGLPAYPGDLVVKEDKAAVADAVRRNARGPAMSGDFAVRLVHQPGEPVALTVAGLRGLGEAAVLLLLKDNSEEAKLKRQVAQATKMQAVGQLAGGVAHDFNNILTAIIGHCDLMLMRHTPGDSDYDDIQQIRSNSNRAAGLTRQLLAFSRQQTLRPQVLQLPDVVSEVSHLLKRLLGETVELVLKHGRDLGWIRADPGQLEQVIVNLAVNARDAMLSKGGGTLSIQTYSVTSDQVAELGSDILPTADYSAISIEDTGTGIAPSILGKVFEPFFTTKEVGKGTGLGLSTVYGIVKQSGGFIFADSKISQGTRFTIYFPVHAAEIAAPKALPRKPKDGELWGTGTVLLVEDEPMVRTVAERALQRHGYKVITATNGEEALEVINRGEPIELLISDVVMPLMDGPTMVREARKTRPKLPILFMSGYAEEQLRKSIDIDNVAFLPKPFSVQELAEAARKVLGAK